MRRLGGETEDPFRSDSFRKTMIMTATTTLFGRLRATCQHFQESRQEPNFSPIWSRTTVWSRDTAILLFQCGVSSLSQTTRSSAAYGSRLEKTEKDMYMSASKAKPQFFFMHWFRLAERKHPRYTLHVYFIASVYFIYNTNL